VVGRGAKRPRAADDGSVLSTLADLLFPPRCGICRAGGPELLCPACRAEFVPVPAPACSRCGIPLGAHSPRYSLTCRRCLRAPPAFASATSAALYSGRMRAAIARFKFEGRAALGLPLGDLLARHARGQATLARADVAVPVPLHQARLRERGYDHAVLLARAVAGALEIPLAVGVLLRISATAPQAGLGARARHANVRGAFRVDPAGTHLIEQRILLVDDILTSGATAAACAETLLAAGAAEVRVATLARAILDEPPRNEGGAAG